MLHNPRRAILVVLVGRPLMTEIELERRIQSAARLLLAMHAAGYVERIGESWAITEAGRTALFDGLI